LAAKPAGKVSVRAILLLVSVALVVLLVDQLAKWWVVTNLDFRVPKNIIGSLLIFEYDRNPGAAFSIGTGSTWIFSIVAVAVLVFVIWYARRIRSAVWAVVFGLVLGGLLGNLTDRLFRPPGFGVGEVVDFLRIPLLPAIFNLADTAIVTAMVIFLLLTVLGVGLDGKRSQPKPTTGQAADAEAPTEGSGGSTDADTESSAPDARAHDDATATGEESERRDDAQARAAELRHPVDGRA
jgi:signal peptidase II